MIATQGKTHVQGSEEIEEKQIRHTGRFLFFKTEWWETVSAKHIGNDLQIITTRPIRHVYLNGKLLSEVNESADLLTNK